MRCRHIVAVLAGLIATPALPALAVVEPAKSADAFVESIGINTHYGNSIFTGGNAYADPQVDAKLANLGIRHIRDHSYNNEALAKIDGLYNNFGIKTTLILGETTRSPADLVNLLKAHPGYEGIEGLNEPDFNARSYGAFTDNPGTNNYSATRAYQNDMYAAIKGDPLTMNRTVLSPAMGNSNNSQYLLPMTSFDVAAMHHYSDGREPSFGTDTSILQMAALRGAKPLMATETGYFNQPAAQTGSIPENVAAKYMLRTFGEYFNRGVQRTYLYEFADQGFDTTQREQNFGFVRFNMTEKPAYTATKNLVELVEEPGANFTPGSLDYAITSSGDTTFLQHTLLQKSTGKYYLMLWNDRPGYNRFSEAEITVAPLPITLSLTTDIALASLYTPNDSASATANYLNPDALNLNVLDKVLVVELTPTPEPGMLGLFTIVAWSLKRPRRSKKALAKG